MKKKGRKGMALGKRSLTTSRKSAGKDTWARDHDPLSRVEKKLGTRIPALVSSKTKTGAGRKPPKPPHAPPGGMAAEARPAARAIQSTAAVVSSSPRPSGAPTHTGTSATKKKPTAAKTQASAMRSRLGK